VSKIKELILEHIVATVLGGIGLLCLVLWQTIDPAIWARLSEAIPKKALWAWLGLAVITVLLEGAYIIHLRRRLYPKLTFHYGVLWDKNFNLYCPKDNEPLHQSQVGGIALDVYPDEFTCIKSDRTYVLKDKNGFVIASFNEAKKWLLEEGAI